MFDITTLFKSFLGANSAVGFCSFFADSYSADLGWRAYIIKGGPGTGKSSMMKALAAHFAEKGERVELCPCSSDPDSLDAAIFHDRKTVIMDGTAPHIVDPKYPGVCERVINLLDCLDNNALEGSEQEIIALTRQNKTAHSRASRYIAAAGELLAENRKIAASLLDEQKIKKVAQKTCHRVMKKGAAAREHKRFLSGITPKGLIFLKNSIAPYFKTVIAIEDSSGAVSQCFLLEIRRQALSLGQEIITCYNAISPDVIDHILIPSLSLAFVSENRYTHPDGITRRIHARRFMDMKGLAKHKQSLGFNRRASEELLREAIKIIAQAKEIHDALEEHYIAAMDFERVGEIAEKVAQEIEKR